MAVCRALLSPELKGASACGMGVICAHNAPFSDFRLLAIFGQESTEFDVGVESADNMEEIFCGVPKVQTLGIWKKL